MRIQENGASGEARTRAFLLDRFWILERSIDAEGADFFIQRRLTSQSLLSRDPPKLGVVQAKFFQDERTTQYVHREYIDDQDGNPREEVFILCHTGTEDSAKMYFLTAQEINANFALSQSDGRSGHYILSGNKVLCDKWIVTSRNRALRAMEQGLINVDFQKNRQFLSWALPNLEDDTSIDPDFLEPIDNWHGSIPEEFFELRKKARNIAYELDDYMILLKTIVETNNPVTAVCATEKFDQDSLRHVGRDLFCPQFAEAVLSHNRWVQSLKSSGLLDAHATLRQKILSYLIDEVLQILPFNNSDLFKVEVRYDVQNLSLVSVSHTITTLDIVLSEADDRQMNKYSGVISSRPGYVSAFIDPSVRGEWLTNPDQAVEKEDFPNRSIYYLLAYVMGKVLEGWYYES